MSAGASSTRPYRSQLRQRQAAETRLRVVEAAVRLFSEQGYRATTFAQLALEAGVSVETVQKHGPKSALLRAAVELASFGVEGETDLFATELGRRLLTLRSADEVATFLGEMMLAVNAPSAGIWMSFVGAAHGDEELSGYHVEMLGSIRVQVERFARYVAQRGWLRDDVPVDDLVEALCVVTCVETYARFMTDGRSEDAYKAFVSRTVRETILVP